MPSWNEKPHVTPTINVNLTPCDRHHLPLDKRDPAYHVLPGTGNLGRCESPPILIPCPIPRSVTFTVRLGECFCTTGDLRDMPQDSGGDLHICPARPIRVSCSISGKTWEESEVTDPEVYRDQNIGINVLPSDLPKLLAACRDLWALVKALVTGGVYTLAARFPPETVDVIHRLHMQRDAVYAALVKLKRTEKAGDDAMADLERAGIHPRTWNKRENSEAALTVYVERLIEQVGALP